MTDTEVNLTWHASSVTREERKKQKGHRSFVLWLTGLSGSGKSTLAVALERKLFEMNMSTYIMDGDNIRMGLNRNLGFSQADRKENIRRIGEVSKLFVDAGTILLSAFISPYRVDRHSVRQLFSEGEFIEVYVRCPLEVCESRDPKGLYRKARAGDIANFTGISAPYEVPDNPEIVVDTNLYSIEECIMIVLDYLSSHGFLKE